MRKLAVAAVLGAALVVPSGHGSATTPCGPWPTHIWCGIPGGDITFHWWQKGMSLSNPHSEPT